MYQRVCQPNAADGSTTAPTHLLLGQVSAWAQAQHLKIAAHEPGSSECLQLLSCEWLRSLTPASRPCIQRPHGLLAAAVGLLITLLR